MINFKGIVSQDFEVCFLVPLDSSDIATPSGAGSFFLKGYDKGLGENWT
jgi:hypothetical protein